MSLPLPLPESRAQIAHIQSERKKKAFALANTVPWYRDKLAGIDANALDDPAEWQKIPILDKDTLRKFTHAELLEAFCAAPRDRCSGQVNLANLRSRKNAFRSSKLSDAPLFRPPASDPSSGRARSRPCRRHERSDAQAPECRKACAPFA